MGKTIVLSLTALALFLGLIVFIAPNASAAGEPEVTGVTPSSLNEGDAGAVTVDITFNEAMNQADEVTVTVEGLAGSPIAVTYDSWQSGTVWRGTFTLTDNNEEVNTA